VGSRVANSLPDSPRAFEFRRVNLRSRERTRTKTTARSARGSVELAHEKHFDWARHLSGDGLDSENAISLPNRRRLPRNSPQIPGTRVGLQEIAARVSRCNAGTSGSAPVSRCLTHPIRLTLTILPMHGVVATLRSAIARLRKASSRDPFLRKAGNFSRLSQLPEAGKRALTALRGGPGLGWSPCISHCG
jgi:hypothetical protein